MTDKSYTRALLPHIKYVPLALYSSHTDDEASVTHNSWLYPAERRFLNSSFRLALAALISIASIFALTVYFGQRSPIEEIIFVAFTGVLYLLLYVADAVLSLFIPFAKGTRAPTYSHTFTNKGEYIERADNEIVLRAPISAISAFEIVPFTSFQDTAHMRNPDLYYDFCAIRAWNCIIFFADGSNQTLFASAWPEQEQARILSALKAALADAVKATRNDKATLERMGRAWLDLRNPAAPAERRAAAETELNNGAASLGWATT